MSVKFNLTHWASLAALVAVGASAVAAEPADVERNRADVVAETLAARAQHTLAPAGEHVVPSGAAATLTSSKTRAEVVSEVAVARANGELLPAGEAPEFTVARNVRGNTTQVASRAAVKASVIAARASGELVPAGEGPDLDKVAGNFKHRPAARVAAVAGTNATPAGQ